MPILSSDILQKNSLPCAITVVIPVYNSEASLRKLCRGLMEVLPAVATSCEFILVNDCSRDRSWETISQLASIFSGAQLFALGVIGEYLARMHFRTMNRPVYFVRSVTGDTKDSQ